MMEVIKFILAFCGLTMLICTTIVSVKMTYEVVTGKF